MELKRVNQDFYVAGQITANDIVKIADQGIKTLICHRPDGEGADQPNVIEIEEAAQRHGLNVIYQPVISGKITDQQVTEFKQLYQNAQKPVLAYCRSGMRAISLWALAEVDPSDAALLVESGNKLGFNLKGLVPRILKRDHEPATIPCYSVVIVGAGAAGVSVASSLLSREPHLDIVIIDPADTHYYQPGWTMVGGGIFKPQVTARSMASVIPSKVKWMKAAVAGFDPEHNQVILEGCQPIQYKALVVCPGLKLNWHGIEGLVETLGKNGVTSNYRYDLAPYTWELVQQLNSGKAIFTQPPMPIKCAGAPQKAMYLSADYWLKQGKLKNISIHFYNTGGVLFGVKEYVPALKCNTLKNMALNFILTINLSK
ncbi:TPA: TIGR01244 family phosphatase [Acinetobacter baumannii]|nr:TIGR01244 family phosphatase [Acinetobacter baumannii]HDV0653433.1 TIGR01244 family phosphatase [Acinetobacter baumannii]HDV0657871.1 TIGR01244 family phosphatase [Acinetobacter baumannii]